MAEQSIDSAAFKQVFEQEVESAQTMSEGPGRKIFIFGAAISDTSDGPNGGIPTILVRGISAGTTKRQGLAYIDTLEHEIIRVKRLLGV